MTIWNLKDLIDYVNHGGVSSSNDGKTYVPARLASGVFFFEKTKAADGFIWRYNR